MIVRLCAMALIAILGCITPAVAQVGGGESPGSDGNARHANLKAEAFIAGNITRGFAILNNAGLSERQRNEQFETLLLSLTDTRRVAVFTLGQYAKNAAQADLDAFTAAFQKYSVTVFRTYLGRFARQTLTVTGSSRRAPDDFIVSTTLIDPDDRSGQPSMKMDFRVRTDTGKPEVTDLNVMGVWLALAQRDDVLSYLSTHGGSVPNLTAHMREVTARYQG